MARYKDPTTGQIIEVGSPDLNPDLIKGKTLVSDTTGIITSADLAPTADLSGQITQPRPTIIPPVAGLDSTVKLTEPETKAEDLSTQIQKLNEQISGQSAFRTQQEQAAGLPELQKTQTDLSGRLKSLQNEALAIPLQL